MLKEIDEQQVISLLSTFSCPKNTDVERFLHNSAIRFEQSDKARTTLILNTETSDIVAYFSLTFKELSLMSATISKGEVKKLDGFNKNAETLQVYLIGQLAKNFAIENSITLPDILDIVYNDINEARKLIGGRTVIVECEDNEHLIALYESQGFKKLAMDNNEDNLITLYTYITD